MPLVVYTALLWGVGLYGGYVLAYQGIEWAGWPLRASVDTFWITSTVALALVSLLFTAMVGAPHRIATFSCARSTPET